MSVPLSPPELLARLGAGWLKEGVGTAHPERWLVNNPSVADGLSLMPWGFKDGWRVEVGTDHHRRSYYWDCATIEAAIAVATLLHAADAVAAGAEVWPDWRTASPDRAIEHDRSAEFGALLDAYSWLLGWGLLICLLGVGALWLYESYSEVAREREAKRELRGPRSHVRKVPRQSIYDQSKDIA